MDLEERVKVLEEIVRSLVCQLRCIEGNDWEDGEHHSHGTTADVAEGILEKYYPAAEAEPSTAGSTCDICNGVKFRNGGFYNVCKKCFSALYTAEYGTTKTKFP